MGVPPNRIDILMSVTGLDFNDAWGRRSISEVGQDKICFISKEYLNSSEARSW